MARMAGARCGLEIESAHALTRLRFRVAALPEALDGIAPGERYSGCSSPSGS
jgi:hypothetical protein